MDIVVVGGTGRTGRRVAARAVERGHAVVVLGRSARPGDPRLPAAARAVTGDALDEAALRAALTGADAVVTALSIPRRSRSVLAPLAGPPDLHSRSTAALLSAMEELSIRRLIKVSAQGVGDSAPRTGWGVRLTIALTNLRPAFVDHARADEMVAGSDLDWTIVRPPVLEDGPARDEVRADEHGVTGTLTRIRTDDVARWIVDALDDPATFRRVLTLVPTGPRRGGAPR